MYNDFVYYFQIGRPNMRLALKTVSHSHPNRCARGFDGFFTWLYMTEVSQHVSEDDFIHLCNLAVHG